MQIKSLLFVSMVSVLGVVACEDTSDGSGGGGGGGSGVSGSKKISQLSDSEAVTLCKSLQKKNDRMEEATNKLLCTAQGLAFSAGDADSCKTELDDCLKMPAEDDDFDLGCDDETSARDDLDGCDDVTVSELESCAEASAKLIESVSAKVSCSSDVEDLEVLEKQQELPAACKKIDKKCPFADDSAIDTGN